MAAPTQRIAPHFAQQPQGRGDGRGATTHTGRGGASPRIIQRQETAGQRGGNREQGAVTHQQLQPNAPGARTGRTAIMSGNGARVLHRNGIGVTPQTARQGRFAAAFAGREAFRNGHEHHPYYPARRAWRNGWRAAFLPWYGAVFWPYAYSDIFDYTFWPYGYEPGYWAYVYDDFFDSIFWGAAGPPEEYVGVSSAPPLPATGHAARTSVATLCTAPGNGITAWPIAEIQDKLNLNPDQQQLLGDLRDAANKAAAVFKTSCPSENAFPLTPPGRLQAMLVRLQATLEAVQTVRPALGEFYASLSDEQKERFNEIGPKQPNNAEASLALAQGDQTCKEQKPGLTNLPIQAIEDVVQPTEAQKPELDRLQQATEKAVSIMQAACPENVPLTPPGRLEMMETRLRALIDAANTVKPSLDSFYASLTNEQKARFNRMGRELANAGG